MDIDIEEEIGAEGWAAIRRAVGRLSAAFGRKIFLVSARTVMMAGRREDLKAIWDNVSKWEVEGYGGTFRFSKELDGEEGWWQKNGNPNLRGLESFIDMTKEEWDDEWVKVSDAHILALLGLA